MIDPVLFTLRIFGLELPVRWYGVIVMTAIVVGAWIVERGLKRRGEDSEHLWDALLWVVLAGVLGARLWYVFNATLGGNRYYMENPLQILNIPQGGLHIFGGFLLGALALLIYLRRNHLDPWLFLDAAGPAALIGQGIGRIANFINQELYGPPTSLPWGLRIAAEHRLPRFPASSFPVETTRFHPTFAYELLWNVAAAGLLLWLARRYEKELKPGTIFAGWLLAAGIGRTWIELFFRTDQPTLVPGISYSAIFAALMAIAGAVMLLVRYGTLPLRIAAGWEETYRISGPARPEKDGSETEEPVEAKEAPPAAKGTNAKKGPGEAPRTSRKKKSS